MTINGRSLTDFGAKMQSAPEIGSCEIVTSIFQATNRSSIQLLDNRRGGRDMRCLIDFWGSAEERAMNRSSFEAVFLGIEPVKIDICDGFWYNAVLVKSEYVETIAELITTVEYTFRVTRHRGNEITVNSETDDISFICHSNVMKTDCIIHMERRYGFKDTRVIINGLNWIVPPEPEGSLTLDGVHKIFLINGKNANNLIQWTDFPYLVPGKNKIQLAIDGVVPPSLPVSVTYTPTFL